MKIVYLIIGIPLSMTRWQVSRSLLANMNSFTNVNLGRISAAGFIQKRPVISQNRDKASSSTSAIPPENVLFRSKNAPTRYAEADIYFANERQSIKNLPESDLLKALHCYTSDFYSHATIDGGTGDWRSLDETALMALGILMEEAARDILGTTGDLVFTEGEQTVELRRQQTPVRRSKSKDRPSKKRRVASID
jgi:hypothetical protein